MRVVFPCKGSLVLLKQDLETLKTFYNTSLLTSKMAEYYKTSNAMVQVGNFNYIPETSALVLYKAHLLTIEEMRKILGIFKESNSQNNENVVSQKDDNSNPISDDDLLSNPFFQTLKQIN